MKNRAKAAEDSILILSGKLSESEKEKEIAKVTKTENYFYDHYNNDDNDNNNDNNNNDNNNNYDNNNYDNNNDNR